MEEAEKKRLNEEKKEARRQAAWALQQQRQEEMRMNDEKRNTIRAKQKREWERKMAERKKFVQDRIALSMVGNEGELIY